MQAGKLRHRIQIVTITDRDDRNSPIEPTEVVYKSLWAEFTSLSGRDLLSAQAISSKVVARLMIRARDDITSEMRVKYRDMVYTIDSPPLYDNESGREYMTFMLGST